MELMGGNESRWKRGTCSCGCSPSAGDAVVVVSASGGASVVSAGISGVISGATVVVASPFSPGWVVVWQTGG